jgi:hypothetical protein
MMVAGIGGRMARKPKVVPIPTEKLTEMVKAKADIEAKVVELEKISVEDAKKLKEYETKAEPKAQEKIDEAVGEELAAAKKQQAQAKGTEPKTESGLEKKPEGAETRLPEGGGRGTEQTIGLNKAEINELTETLGTKELAPAEKRTFERNLSEAKESKLDQSAENLADEIIKSKRQLTDVEHASMVVRAGQIKKEYDAATESISKLVESGNGAGAKLEMARRNAIRDRMGKLMEASDLAGRESARALSIRRMLLNAEDLSLARSLSEAKALKGKPLSPKEVKRIEDATNDYDNDYDALQKQYDDLVKKHEAEMADRDRIIAERVAANYSRKSTIKARSAGERQSIQAERADIKKQIAALGFRVNDIPGLTPEASYLVGRLALNYVKEGVVGVKQVAKRVMTDIPDIMEADIYRAINAKDPRIQAKAKSEALKNVDRIKREAKLLDEMESGGKALNSQLRELQDLSYKTAPDAARLERSIELINEIRGNIEAGNATIEQIQRLRQIVDTEGKIANLNKQLETGDFIIPEKPAPKWMPEELERAQVELKAARRRVRGAVDAVEPWTAKRVGIEAINTARTIKATADMSGTFRQGLISVIHNPKAGAVNFYKAVHATFSKYEAERINGMLREMDTHYLREKANLHLSELEGRPNAKEEMFLANAIEKVPGVGHIVQASNRHMTTFLNLMRTSMFDEFVGRFPNATYAELKAYANWINVCTGRGDLKPGVATGLSTVLFAPRFAISRVQTPFMICKHWKDPRVRKEIAKDAVKVATTGAAALALAGWAGVEVGDDPRSADWGKIKIGDTRIDIWGGIQQPMRVIARIGMGVTDKAGWTGKELWESQKNIDPIDIIYRFSSYKLAPSITIPKELYTGKTMVGEKVTPSQTAVRTILPMFIEDVRDAYREVGTGQAISVGALTFMGVGASTYPSKGYLGGEWERIMIEIEREQRAKRKPHREEIDKLLLQGKIMEATAKMKLLLNMGDAGIENWLLKYRRPILRRWKRFSEENRTALMERLTPEQQDKFFDDLSKEGLNGNK